MDILRNFLSSIIILIAIPLLIVTTLSVAANRTLFSEVYVKEAAEEHNLYAAIVDLAQNAPREEGAEADIGTLVAEHLTPKRARAAFEPAITTFYRWLRDQGDLKISLDLREIKAEIKPTLSRQDQAKLDEEYPDELTLADPASLDEEQGGIALVKKSYERARKLQNLAPFFVLGLLLLLVAINGGKSRLRRPAYVFLVSGLLVGIAAGLALTVTQLLLNRVNESAGLSAVLQESTRGLAQTVGSDITRTVFLFGIAYVVLAIALFVASIFLKQPLAAQNTKK